MEDAVVKGILIGLAAFVAAAGPVRAQEGKSVTVESVSTAAAYIRVGVYDSKNILIAGCRVNFPEARSCKLMCLARTSPCLDQEEKLAVRAFHDLDGDEKLDLASEPMDADCTDGNKFSNKTPDWGDAKSKISNVPLFCSLGIYTWY